MGDPTSSSTARQIQILPIKTEKVYQVSVTGILSLKKDLLRQIKSPVTPLLTSNSKAPGDNSLASCVYHQPDQGHLMPSGILHPCRHLGRAMVASRGDLVLNLQRIVATMPRKQANSSCDWVKIQVQIQSQMQRNGHVVDTIRNLRC